ncbi:winged helix-turn-helix domain-containing protein [Halarcobacter sp.]|uniref:response regulator transcription factor n=1 Tax=Halarcobacter sp. TaxID=2321133 RepID=UPI0029F58DA7|nr:winged helix-turn-helix domain-containing protein [Halarcobacter sp.]
MTLKNLLVLYVCTNKKSEDEILPILNENLKKVFIANSLKEAQKSYKKYSPCIVVVDDSFEDANMIAFLKEIRKSDIKTAFIVISSSLDNKYVNDLIELYITKYLVRPFLKDEFLIALNKCLQVIESRIYSNVKLGKDMIFNHQTQTITKDSEIIVLNKKETILINLFIQNQNRVITYEELEYHIWDNESTTAALKSLIRDFRKKTYKSILQNFSGIGYKLNIQI